MLYYNIGADRDSLACRREAHIGMKWFRSNIKHGSRLALLALAIQFVLSFGHFHGVAAQAAPAIQSARSPTVSHGSPRRSVSASASSPRITIPTSNRTMAARSAPSWRMANAVLFATPPLLLLPQAVEFLYLTTDAEFVHLNSARVAFQPRAPPIS